MKKLETISLPEKEKQALDSIRERLDQYGCDL